MRAIGRGRASNPFWYIACCGLLALASPRLVAQTTSFSWQPTVGASVGGSLPSRPPISAPALISVGVGIDVQRAWIALRPAVQWIRSVSNADDLSICPPVAPGGTCYEPTYARSYWAATVDGRAAPTFLRGGYGLLGVGRTALRAGSIYRTSQPLPRSRSLVRFGLGTALGRSTHAPRLEVVSTHFTEAAGSARHLLTAGLWFE